MTARIVGWGHSPFGNLTDKTLEDLIVDTTREAVAHAGVEYADIDGIWLGHFNSGLVGDGFASSLVLNANDDLQYTPSVRVENACASGSAAVYAARHAIQAGEAKIAIVVGVEKMTSQTTQGVTAALAGASYQREEEGVSFPQIFARFASRYFEENGDHSRALAKIAAKNHANALKNPLAHLRKDLGFDACNMVSEKNPIIASPLRMTDCSLISDGAAVLVLASEDVARTLECNVGFRSAVQVNDYLPMSRRDILSFGGPKRAFQNAFQQSGVGLEDISFAEIHDCFTIAELLIYEAMGLAPKGRGADVLEDGTVYADGRLPINLSGGLKAKGHPVGATGVSMHVLAAQQVTEQAGDLQVSDAKLGLVFNMGGSGVANYCSILENLG